MTAPMTIPLHARGYTIGGILGAVLMAVAVIWLGWQGKWLGCIISLLFLAVSVAFMCSRDHFPALFDLLFVIAALANGAGWVWELYSQVIGYDEIVHAYTTFAGSLSLGFALYYSARAHLHTVVFGFAIATMGIAGGALWEIFEWTAIYVTDPVSDLVADSIGAIIAAGFGTWVLKLEAQDDRHASH